MQRKPWQPNRLTCSPPPPWPYSSSGALPAWLAFSLAGEKMPWLTLHIALPTILTASFGLGYLFHTFDLAAFQAKRGWLLVGVLADRLWSACG